ncbi:MAG: WG repeat-containing protein [Moraxellaceae bacterium]|nr:WG repeat-containing protein [Moraxellaceae bacterium]
MKFSQLKLLLTVLLASTFMTNAYSARCKIPKSYYKHVSCTSDKRYFLAKADSGKAVALINRGGRESADLMIYQKVLTNKMNEGLLPVMKNGKVGYISANGNLVIPFMYDALNGSNWARGFHNRRAVVKKHGRLGVINTNNGVIVPFSQQIQGISDFSSGKARMRKRGKIIIIDSNGREIIQKRKTVKPKKRIEKRKTKKKTIKLKKRNTIVKRRPVVIQKRRQAPIRRSVPKSIHREEALSKDRLNQLLRDYQDNPQMPMTQTSRPQAQMPQQPITDREMQLFPAQSDGKWGFVDDKNVTMITYSFNEVTPFSEGLAGVRIDDKWGFIDKAGDLIVDFNYPQTGIIKNVTDKINPFTFYKKTAWVGNLRDGTKLCIDTMGKNKPCPNDF